MTPIMGVQGAKPPETDEFLHVKGDFKKQNKIMNIKNKENVGKKSKGGGLGEALDPLLI